jgi:polysaccharide export outer membrane protein
MANHNKFEIRSTKHGTNPKKRNFKSSVCGVSSLGKFEFGVCFGFRISCFEFLRVLIALSLCFYAASPSWADEPIVATTPGLPCQTCMPGCVNGCQPQIQGVDCLQGNGCGEVHWKSWGPIPWQAFGQGEYVGPPRPAHVPEYRLRVDDQIEFVFRLKRDEVSGPYLLDVGDEIQIESLIDEKLNRKVIVQPDGTVDLLLLGAVRVIRRTSDQIRDDLNEKYKKFYRITDINVTRVKTQAKADDLLQSVNNRFFSGGQGKQVRVTPEGTVALPSIGVVPAQGLTLDEIGREVNERYRQIADGLELTPILLSRAPRYVYVTGEVRSPGRFEMVAPTTAMQALALAGGRVNGGNMREIVVFRRAEDWRLIATKLDLNGAWNGRRPVPSDEIWLRDSDVVAVPRMPIRQFDDLVELYMTRGVYAAFPINFGYFWNSTSTVATVGP